MQTRNVLLAALLTALAACQPETPKQPEESAMSSPGVMQGEPAVPSAMIGAAEPAVKPVTPAPVAQTPKVATAVAVKPVAAAPLPAPAPVQPPVVKAKTSGVLSEADALALAKKSKCLVCHALDKKLVGPSWRDVAAKYRGDAGAEAMLMDKIAKGGKGVWGAIAMPPNPQVNEGDRRRLAQFILSLK
jgi:cytochrome c